MDAMMIPLTFTSPDYVVGEQKLPALNASASKDSAGVIHITLVNIDPGKTITVNTSFKESKWTTVTGKVLTSPKITDINTFENPANIKIAKFDGAKKQGENLNVILPAKSIVLLELK
jgi:alpha-N-arabinofuranosidase